VSGRFHLQATAPLLGPIEIAANKVGVSVYSPEDGNIFCFVNTVFFSISNSGAMVEVHKSSDSDRGSTFSYLSISENSHNTYLHRNINIVTYLDSYQCGRVLRSSPSTMQCSAKVVIRWPDTV
jgi:hypothetical protein